jgi:hypothetical protein
VTKLAGEFAATVLLCQLSYMLLVGNMAGLEPATFEGTVDFTTGETFWCWLGQHRFHLLLFRALHSNFAYHM